MSKGELRERLMNAKRKTLQRFEIEIETLLSKKSSLSSGDNAALGGFAALPVFAQVDILL